ncbi:DUF6089 family protein [Arcticibacterium luteifluviistationis]|uniref:DUF6089 domain-containing protein n=1 Tax=Arcticibacterium luteifluviistationis TaxID=1784714 RepID=A0A2Z4GCC0_9BACT|nr:DUF6089 family protein [Arcticibacterium luteifluviistationis]AWV98942.1 hypothetical protein DJ013_12470 [Arcticibacterium luteifluviistationis]
MTKTKLISIFFLLSLTCNAQALEVGIGSGFTSYRGDLNPNFNPLLARPAANVMVRYNFSRAFSLKGRSMYGFITGKDALSSNPLNKERDWSFDGQIMNWGLDLEYNFLNFRASGTIVRSKWTPILFLGIEQYRMPKRNFHANGLTYSDEVDSPSKALSYGFGFKKELNAKWNLSASLGCKLAMEKSNNDYFDGFGYFDDETEPYKNIYPDAVAEPAKYSTPNAHVKDRFFYANVTLSYVFSGVRCP